MRKIIFTAIVLVAFVAAVGSASVGAATNQNNGNKSVNKAIETRINTLSVKQKSSALQQNLVGVSQNSGLNTANKNTDGNVEVTTGKSEAEAAIGNAANENSAQLTDCGCEGSTAKAENVGNGNKSRNTAKVYEANHVSLSQKNFATQINTVLIEQNSGGNSANKNTGGAVEVNTGDTATTVIIENVANTNTAVIE